MKAQTVMATKPLLLFDGECAVCRTIARWVQKAAPNKAGETSIAERPIGDDPEALRTLNANLDIWDAYATIHVLMPDGSMKLGGEAVAEVFRNLPVTKWFTPIFAVNIFGVRPFAMILNLGYTVLADVRPLLGCESCGAPAGWVKPFARSAKWIESRFRTTPRVGVVPHFTSSKGRAAVPAVTGVEAG